MTIRVAVIGAGAWGLNHVRVAASEPGCELVAVVDPDPSAIDRASELAPRVRTLRDPDQAFATPDLDAVIIASPANTHTALACAALEAGKHVLVEKPMALGAEDAQRLVSIASRSQRAVLVGHLMVHHPAIVRLRELLRSGSLGKLHYVHSSRVNLGKLRRDENVLWSFGPHDLSILDFLLEKLPVSVTARGQQLLQPGVEDVVFMTLRYADGEMAHINLSWLHPRKERRVTVVCSQKMVEFDDVAADKLRIYDKGYDRPPNFTEYGQYLTVRDGDVLIPRLTMVEPLRLQLRAFLDAIRSGSTSVAGVESGLRVVRTLEAAQASLAIDGAPVAIA